ncbi:hypothetical protein N9C27_00025 [Luminiphilus sp.]|nr:hypothetical protein [Luminiphilus sp.]
MIKVSGMTEPRINSRFLACVLFACSFASPVNADLNTFSPGDPIRSSEINENFEYLAEEIGSQARSGCSEDQLIGLWGEERYGFNSNNVEQRQTVLITFYSDGTAAIDTTFGTEAATYSATYSLDAGCKLALDMGSGATLGKGFVAMNGYVLIMTTRDTDDGNYEDWTFLKIGE